MFDNPIRGRFNAYFLAAMDGYMHRKYSDLKTRMFQKAPSVIVEIGPGTGANLRYMPKGTRLIAVEPNRRMHPLLRQRARRKGIELDLRGVDGERRDLASSSVDFVFTSLVLCTVTRPEVVLAEVVRVLRSGGRFACIEHVAAPVGSGVRAVQGLIASPWRWVFEGCDLCRETGASLQAAGFSQVQIEHIVAKTIFVPLRHQIAAECVK
jgi:ubiquinone/menaquinone biosynthesis C-methylase UbiE